MKEVDTRLQEAFRVESASTATSATTKSRCLADAECVVMRIRSLSMDNQSVDSPKLHAILCTSSS